MYADSGVEEWHSDIHLLDEVYTVFAGDIEGLTLDHVDCTADHFHEATDMNNAIRLIESRIW